MYYTTSPACETGMNISSKKFTDLVTFYQRQCLGGEVGMDTDSVNKETLRETSVVAGRPWHAILVASLN